jgi:hypothetical protein
MFIPRRKKFLIALLAAGTIGGYAWGFHSMRWHHWQRQKAFERHIAQICVDAARDR